jgi:hypothetical protein
VERFCFLKNLQVLHELLGGCPPTFLLTISKQVTYIMVFVNDINQRDLVSSLA